MCNAPLTRINHSFLHLYLQFYYVSVAVVLPYSWYVGLVRGTVYVVRIIFEVLP